MKQLVEKLLILARSDNQDSILPMNTLNLSKLVLNAAISFEGVFSENIVTQHKGKIWAESQNGVNSFFVELQKDI